MGSTSKARLVAGTAALALTLVLAAVGCTQTNSPVGRYRVISFSAIHDDEMLVEYVQPGTSITIEFTADGKMSGKACNSFGGSWARAGQGFRITNVFSTDMACPTPPGVMGQEMRFLDRLDEVGSVQRRGNRVVFGSPGEPSYSIFEAERL